MKILMLNPAVRSGKSFIRTWRDQLPAPIGVGIWPPIDLFEIAGALRRQGFGELKIIDSVIDRDSFSGMIRRVIQFQPDLLILHNITPALADDLEAVRILKSRLFGLKVAFFGAHATILAEEVLKSGVDFSVRGEPDDTCVELAEFLSAGEEGGLYSIRGLSFMHNGKVQHNPERCPETELDRFSHPARDLLDNRKYKLLYKDVPFTIIRFSKGCPYGCTYCTSGFYAGLTWRCRSAKSIVEEINDVRRQFGINDFMFLADTFTVNEELILELCRLLKQECPGISWFCNSRTDTLTLKMALAMKEAGCWLVSLGIESADDNVLNNVKKGATANDARRSVSILRQAGLKSIGYFMFGLPGDNPSTVERTIGFASELDVDYAYFFAATPFPGTEFYRAAKERGWITSLQWSRYCQGRSDVVSLPGLNGKQVLSSVNRAYRKFYFRPSRLVKELKEMRNIRGFFRYLWIGAKLLASGF